jgi:hypothetical protein
MPKTFTNDVAPALPSAIQGPFQVTDPSDDSSWIKVDPANARIVASGGAKPVRILTVDFARAYGSGSSSFISTTIASRTVGASSIGGAHYTPFQIPFDMDVSQACTVKILASPATDATTNGQAIHFTLDQNHVNEGGGPGTSSDSVIWSVPDDWTTSDVGLVTIDTGNGYTFAGGTFQPGDHLGLRVIRNALAAEDTFDKGVKISEHLLFEYPSTDF